MKVDPQLIGLARASGFDLAGAVRHALAAAKDEVLPQLAGRDDVAVLDEAPRLARPVLKAAFLAALDAHVLEGQPRQARRVWKTAKARIAAGLPRLCADIANDLARMLAAEKAATITETAVFEDAVADAFD